LSIDQQGILAIFPKTNECLTV